MLSGSLNPGLDLKVNQGRGHGTHLLGTGRSQILANINKLYITRQNRVYERKSPHGINLNLNTESSFIHNTYLVNIIK